MTGIFETEYAREIDPSESSTIGNANFREPEVRAGTARDLGRNGQHGDPVAERLLRANEVLHLGRATSHHVAQKSMITTRPRRSERESRTGGSGIAKLEAARCNECRSPVPVVR